MNASRTVTCFRPPGHGAGEGQALPGAGDVGHDDSSVPTAGVGSPGDLGEARGPGGRGLWRPLGAERGPSVAASERMGPQSCKDEGKVPACPATPPGAPSRGPGKAAWTSHRALRHQTRCLKPLGGGAATRHQRPACAAWWHRDGAGSGWAWAEPNLAGFRPPSRRGACHPLRGTSRCPAHPPCLPSARPARAGQGQHPGATAPPPAAPRPPAPRASPSHRSSHRQPWPAPARARSRGLAPAGAPRERRSAHRPREGLLLLHVARSPGGWGTPALARGLLHSLRGPPLLGAPRPRGTGGAANACSSASAGAGGLTRDAEWAASRPAAP